MQFYIINFSPAINARELPVYALKVNVREGYQMLSDIGHVLGINWYGQNKSYNPYHAETRQYWKSVVEFEKFLAHYEACLEAYQKKYGISKFHINYDSFLQKEGQIQIAKKIYDEETPQNWQVRKYLLTQKRKNLSQEEIESL